VSKQINLLGQMAAEAPAFSALRVLMGFGVVCVAFVGYGGLAWFRTAQLAGTVQQANIQLATEKAKVKELEQKLATRPKLADITAQINALKAREAESQEILNLLRGGADGKAGYSGHLTALARISEDGVWLSSVQISHEGKTVRLAGQSLRNESVLRYAQRLNEQFSAYGLQFSAVELATDPATTAGSGSPAIAFRLY
jgi:hypothetical protein